MVVSHSGGYGWLRAKFTDLELEVAECRVALDQLHRRLYKGA